MNNKVAVVELGTSHAECIYSHVLFLRESGHEVHFIFNEKRNDNVAANVEQIIRVKYSLIGLIKAIRYLYKNNIRTLVINSCSGWFVRWFCFLLIGKFNITGIRHNGWKLQKWSSQYPFLWRVKKYFVINDYVKQHLNISMNIKVESFYPIFYEAAALPSPQVERDYLSICIPGSLELKRRDYEVLFDTFNGENIGNVRFNLLGGKTRRSHEDFLWIREKIAEKGLTDKVTFFNAFVPEDEFYNMVRETDLIMPLVHPSKSTYAMYGKYKVPGAFNLAFGFKKPLLMESFWSEYDDFKNNSIFYKMQSLFDVVKNLEQNRHLLEDLKKSYESNGKLSFETQSKRYLDFIKQ